MKKILYCIGIGLLIINSIIAAGTTVDNYEPDVINSDIIETKGEQQQYEPLIGEFKVVVDKNGRSETELVGSSKDINWDKDELTVWIKFNVSAEYNPVDDYDPGTVTVRWRINRWENIPFMNIIFFMFQRDLKTNTNESSLNKNNTRGDRDNNPGFGIFIGMNSYTMNYSNGWKWTDYVPVDITFYELYGIVDVAMYMCEGFPLGHLHSDYGSVKVHFP